MAITDAVIKAQMTMKITATDTDNSVAEQNLNKGSYNVAIPGDATLAYNKKVTVTAAGSTTLDLSGSLTNQLKQSCVFTKVYGLMIINENLVTGDYVYFGGSEFSTPFGDASDKIKIGPNGCLFLNSPVDGYTVTATTGDILTIGAPGSNNVVVRIIIYGK